MAKPYAADSSVMPDTAAAKLLRRIDDLCQF